MMILYPLYLGILIILRLMHLITTNYQLIYVSCLGVFTISICILVWESFNKELTQFYKSEIEKYMREKPKW